MFIYVDYIHIFVTDRLPELKKIILTLDHV